MKKLLALMLTMILLVGLVGCVGNDLPTEEKEDEPAKVENTKEDDKKEDDKASDAGSQKEIVLADELKLNVALGNNARTITYNQATPMTMPDGTVITQGDLKPTWQYFQQELGFSIVDTAVQDQKATEMIDIAAATSFSEATVFGGNSIAESLMNYGALGYFVNLKDYLDQMPNFGEYLAKNPNIANAITAYDGGIYHVPYAAELGNYARIFLLREDWTTALLDSDDAIVAETASLDVAYESFWGTDRHASNVVDLQNAAAGGSLTASVARDTLLTYIADTYPELAKPSDLYLGENAQYDMDELVALLRVVKLSPNTLTTLATGDVVDGAVISPYFVRKSKYREDAFRLINYFGGQRVYGSDSYAARFYTDADGELQYSYAEDGFLKGIEQMKAMFSEGLIHSEFSDLSTTDDFRKALITKDTEEGHQQFGFMTGDWIASTTAANPEMMAILPPVTTLSDSNGEFVHFVENTRVIKPDGWSISASSSEEEINSALALFDFIFTKEGHIAQNYGVPQILAEGETYTGSDGKDYPKFGQWIHDNAAELKNGDFSGFLRDFVGSHIPIGYQKEIGFELQYTKNNGDASWALYTGNEVKSTSYNDVDPAFRLVPPVFSMNEQDLAKLSTLAVGEDQVDAMFLYITGAEGAVASAADIKQSYIDAGIEQYIDVYRTAYNRMIGK